MIPTLFPPCSLHGSKTRSHWPRAIWDPDARRDPLLHPDRPGRGLCVPQLVACFPDGVARYKLEAIMRHWEIQIDQTNLEVLVPAFEDLKKEPAAGPEADGVREVFDGLCGMLAVLQANSWSPSRPRCSEASRGFTSSSSKGRTSRICLCRAGDCAVGPAGVRSV